MTQKKRGRPRKVLQDRQEGQLAAARAFYAPTTEVKLPESEPTNMPQALNYITLNTAHVKGLRVNLDMVLSYAPNGEKSIQLSQGVGGNTMLNFSSTEDMMKALEVLDSKCL